MAKQAKPASTQKPATKPSKTGKPSGKKGC